MRIRDERKKDWWWAENEIIDRTDLTIYEKMAYLVLCRHSDQNSRCYPSTKTVAKKMGCSHRQAKVVLKNIREKQLIDTRHRISTKGDKTSNEYTIYSAKVEGVVHQDYNLEKDVSHPSAPETTGIVQDMPQNNTNIEQHSCTTTCADIKNVVVVKEMKEEYNENTVQVPLKSKTILQIIKRYTPQEPWEFYHAAWVLNWMMRPDTYNYEPTKGYENVLCGMLKNGVIHPDNCPTPSEVKKQELEIAARKKAAESKKINREAEDKALEEEFHILPDETKQTWILKAKEMGLKKTDLLEITAFSLWKEDSVKKRHIP